SRSVGATASRAKCARARRSRRWCARNSARSCRRVRKLRMTEKLDLKLTINGREQAIRVEPRKTLVDAIREDCGLTGTHIGCEHGVCGACTVIVGDEAVRSCLMFAVQAHGQKIRTVEGLAKNDRLHP